METRSSKRLLFDRRYGWVFDEWKDPSEEALAGGRGMFCVLPLTKALLSTASQSINFAATSAHKLFERPDLLSPQLLQINLGDQLNKLKSSIQVPEFSSLGLSKKSITHSSATSRSSNLHMGSAEPHQMT